uniref:Hypothetical LOC441242 n=1 Tax=Homo sapiens TaxID=9606 RepID=Q6NXN2_HUMAN
MRGPDQMEIRGGPYLLLGEVVGHSALGAQPAQAANGDADELLELSALLQPRAGRGPCATLSGRCITPATALLLLSHRLRAQCRPMQATAAEAGSPGLGRLGKEPPSRESWTGSAPRRCPCQDASRAGSGVCRSRPQSRGGGSRKPRRQKAAATGAKSRGGAGKKLRRRGQKAAAAQAKSLGGGGKKPRRQKCAAAGQKAAAEESRRGGGKKPRRGGQKAVGAGAKKPQKAAAAGTKTPRRRRQKAAKAAVWGQKAAAGESLTPNSLASVSFSRPMFLRHYPFSSCECKSHKHGSTFDHFNCLTFHVTRPSTIESMY